MGLPQKPILPQLMQWLCHPPLFENTGLTAPQGHFRVRSVLVFATVLSLSSSSINLLAINNQLGSDYIHRTVPSVANMQGTGLLTQIFQRQFYFIHQCFVGRFLEDRFRRLYRLSVLETHLSEGGNHVLKIITRFIPRSLRFR